MKLNLIIILGASFLVACAHQPEKTSRKLDVESDFNNVCHLYEDVSKGKIQLPSDPSSRAMKLAQLLDLTIKTEELKNTFAALASVDPSEKAKLFEQTATEELGKNWSCPAMDNYYRNTH